MKKRGISLLVLIITIIVIVVLATAIIVSLANNNPVENANEATFKSDLANIKDLVNLASTDILLEKEGASYKGIIPEEYEKKLEIYEGVLYYKGEAGQEEEWAKEVDVLRRKDIPEDWIDIAENTPEDGISLLIGKPTDTSATISFKVTSTGGYKVDWGDGTSDSTIASETEVSHTYSTNSDKSSTDGYLFEVKITPDSGGNITKFEHTQTTDSPLIWCQVGCDTLTDCNHMLYSASNLKKFGTTTETSLSKVTSMESMFNGCSSLKTIPQLDTSKVETMKNMFQRCSSLTKIPELNTSKVTSMMWMFGDCSSLEEIPELDTSSVTTMMHMFNGCSSLTTIPKLDTNKVKNMFGTFMNCSSLTIIPELDTRNVVTMLFMFQKCSSLEKILLLDTRNATDMTWMFDECNSLKSISIANTDLTDTQINRVFRFLPESTDNPVIDITGNPGESDCDRTQAIEKGWTIIP